MNNNYLVQVFIAKRNQLNMTYGLQDMAKIRFQWDLTNLNLNMAKVQTNGSTGWNSPIWNFSKRFISFGATVKKIERFVV